MPNLSSINLSQNVASAADAGKTLWRLDLEPGQAGELSLSAARVHDLRFVRI